SGLQDSNFPRNLSRRRTTLCSTERYTPRRSSFLLKTATPACRFPKSGIRQEYLLPSLCCHHLDGGDCRGESSLPPLGAIFCEDGRDRKSTRLNSSHANISYAVFCLKKKKQK